MEVVWVDKKPFMMATSSVEARYYDKELDLIKFTSKRKDGVLRKAYMDSKGSMEIQRRRPIMPYRLTSDPIIEEIDDE